MPSQGSAQGRYSCSGITLEKSSTKRGISGDPAGNLVRHLRNGEAPDQPLVCRLRAGGRAARQRLELAPPAAPDSKHLCGQTCLHKLVDEFMAKSIAVRAQRALDMDEAARRIAGYCRCQPDLRRGATSSWNRRRDCSRRLRRFHPSPLFRPQPELVTMPSRPHAEDFPPIPAETPRYASRNWRAEAWERERERELRAIENRPDIAERRRSSA